MQSWQQRVYDERSSLGIKTAILSVFLSDAGPDIPYDEIALLEKQLDAMLGYYDLLSIRIGRFEMIIGKNKD